jgi:hypothetical protein
VKYVVKCKEFRRCVDVCVEEMCTLLTYVVQCKFLERQYYRTRRGQRHM